MKQSVCESASWFGRSISFRSLTVVNIITGRMHTALFVVKDGGSRRELDNYRIVARKAAAGCREHAAGLDLNHAALMMVFGNDCKTRTPTRS